MEVQLLRQPLHQVRALVSSEGAGGETQRQLAVTFGGPYLYEKHAAIHPLKCYFLGIRCRNSDPHMGHCTQAKATVV